MMSDGVLTFLIAAALTWIACPLIGPSLRAAGLVDVPNERSSHLRPTVRGGGLACFFGVSLALILVGEAPIERGAWPMVVVVVSLFAALGFADDVRSLPASVRLSAQVVLALAGGAMLAASPLSPHGLTLVAGIGVWCVVIVNTFNFMDGINGISAATTVLVALSLAAVSLRWDAGVELAALAVAGSAVGFAPVNLGGRLFLGDVGSYLLGSALALLAAGTVLAGAPVLSVVVPFLLYLVDVFNTLRRRALRGAPLFRAHREHVYQQLANDLSFGHLATVGVVVVITGGLVVAAQLSAAERLPPIGTASMAGALVLLYLSSPALARGLRSEHVADQRGAKTG